MLGAFCLGGGASRLGGDMGWGLPFGRRASSWVEGLSFRLGLPVWAEASYLGGEAFHLGPGLGLPSGRRADKGATV